MRFRRIDWGNAQLALVEERRWKDRKRIILALSPSTPASPAKLFEGSFEDRYHDPGEPVEDVQRRWQACPSNHDRWPRHLLPRRGRLSRRRQTLLVGYEIVQWRPPSSFGSLHAPNFEHPVAVLDPRTATILIRKESHETESELLRSENRRRFRRAGYVFPESLRVRAAAEETSPCITNALTASISVRISILPPGYKPQDGPLPTLLEAYPTEFKTRAAAGQVTGSPYAFVVLKLGLAGSVCHARLRSPRKRQHPDRRRRKRRAQ